MLGAGLIKIRCHSGWWHTGLTVMDWFYETKEFSELKISLCIFSKISKLTGLNFSKLFTPAPNPLSWLMHKTPHWFHAFEIPPHSISQFMTFIDNRGMFMNNYGDFMVALMNHFVELISCWLLIAWPFPDLLFFGF